MTERRTGGTVSTPDDRWANLEALGRATRGRGPRKRMSPGRRRRLTWTISVALSVVVVMAAAGALVGYRYADRLVGKGQRRVANLAPVASGAPVNILLVGSDSRDGLSRRELGRIQTATVDGQRTDTIIVLHVSPEREKAVMVSIPGTCAPTSAARPTGSTRPSPSAAPTCWSRPSRRSPGCRSSTTPRSTSPASSRSSTPSAG